MFLYYIKTYKKKFFISVIFLNFTRVKKTF